MLTAKKQRRAYNNNQCLCPTPSHFQPCSIDQAVFSSVPSLSKQETNMAGFFPQETNMRCYLFTPSYETLGFNWLTSSAGISLITKTRVVAQPLLNASYEMESLLLSGRGKVTSSQHPFWGKNASLHRSLSEARDSRKWQRWGWVWTTYVVSVLLFVHSYCRIVSRFVSVSDLFRSAA